MPVIYDDEVIFAGEGTIPLDSALILDGQVVFPGEGTAVLNLTQLPLSAVVSLFGAGSFYPSMFTPQQYIRVRFEGTSSINIATIAPRLVASANFAGSGTLRSPPNPSAFVFSNRSTHRFAYPTVPTPSDPFVRRETKSYKNHTTSSQIHGSGRLSVQAIVV